MTTQQPLTTLDNQQLSSLSQVPETPFLLSSSVGELSGQQVLRFLPGKRLVFRAELNGKMVIAKCLFGSSHQRDQKREITGIKGFQRSGANTPELITSSSCKDFSLVITACLDPVVSFEDIWNGQLSDHERKHWLTTVAQMMAALHKAGVQQMDIHLDNLLLHDNKLFLIDGGGAQAQSTPLSPKTAMENIALFQAVLYPIYDRYLGDVWQSYSKLAPENTTTSSLNEFAKLVQNQRKWREKFILKGLRNCTRFRVEKTWFHFLSVDRKFDKPALHDFLNNPEKLLFEGKLLKRGRTNTVGIVTLADGQKVLVKRYKSKKGILHKYLRCLRQSRARISWLNGLLLEMVGIETPSPMAMLEHRFGPITTCSYIINEYVEGEQALGWFTQEPLPENAMVMAEKVSDTLRILERALISHGDLKATNILLVDDKPSLIDLDAMRSHKDPVRFKRAHKNDIERFSRNWKGNPETQRLFESFIDK